MLPNFRDRRLHSVVERLCLSTIWNIEMRRSKVSNETQEMDPPSSAHLRAVETRVSLFHQSSIDRCCLFRSKRQTDGVVSIDRTEWHRAEPRRRSTSWSWEWNRRSTGAPSSDLTALLWKEEKKIQIVRRCNTNERRKIALLSNRLKKNNEREFMWKQDRVATLKIVRTATRGNDRDFYGHVHSFLSVDVVNGVRLYRRCFQTS